MFKAIRLNSQTKRKISLYGWVRGTNIKRDTPVHIPGVGDLRLQSISAFADPCPLPANQKKGRRTLNEKEQIIYSPFSGLGGVVYDRDAIYIDTGGSQAHLNEKPNELSDALGKIQETLDLKLEKSKLALLSDSVPLGEYVVTF